MTLDTNECTRSAAFFFQRQAGETKSVHRWRYIQRWLVRLFVVTPLKPFWFFDLPGCLDPRKFFAYSTACFLCMLRFLGFCPHSLFPLYAALSWIFAPQPHTRVGCQKASVGRAKKNSLENGWLHRCWLMVLTMMEKTCQMTFCQWSWNVLVVWHVK